MSFSSQAKDEMCRVKVSKDCCAAAEIYGSLLLANTFDYNEIRMVTENLRFSERIRMLIKRVFSFEFDKVTKAAKGQNDKETLIINDSGKLARILEYYGYDSKRHFMLHLNAAMLEEDHCRGSFIRGLFLSSGSVTDPEKTYHLELVTRHFTLSKEISALLLDMGFTPKSTTRKSNYLTYFKDSGEIEDFLTVCGARKASLMVMEAKVEREVRNRVNRQVNCETANLLKTVDAAQRQLEAIEIITLYGGYQQLPEKLQYAAKLREEYPDAPLTELVLHANGGISRSGLNHRLNKLISIAEEYERKG